jgi:DNA gyrase subunit A
MQMSERNGCLVGAIQVFAGDEVMLISDQGTLVRTRTSEVGIKGRNTQGVTLIKLQAGENLVQVARVAESIGKDETLVIEDESMTSHVTIEEDAQVLQASTEDTAIKDKD